MSIHDAALSQSRLREVLSYEPETGHFRWRVKLSSKSKIGSLAGCVNDDGYVLIRIDGLRHRAHRLAFLYMTGVWPRETVDHINRETSDNRWQNLRAATRSENLWNARAHRDNRTGLKGVSFHRGRWVAQIAKNGTHKWLGTFDNAISAHRAYAAAATAMHGAFARPQ